ncbi:MAG TPA: PA2779 family protein [Burkholderiales bacterium]
MIGTGDLLQRERIHEFLDRADVQAQLHARGVNPEAAKARVAAMTDAEAAELAARIDELPAGGIGIIGAILIVFLVLLLTDILGYTKIFPFTRSAR